MEAFRLCVCAFEGMDWIVALLLGLRDMRVMRTVPIVPMVPIDPWEETVFWLWGVLEGDPLVGDELGVLTGDFPSLRRISVDRRIS